MALSRAVLGMATRRAGALIRSYPSCYALATNRHLSDSKSQNFNVEMKDNTAIVTMSKKSGNTLDFTFLKEFSSMMDDVEKSARGMILISGTPKIFSAGLNLMQFSKFETADEVEHFIDEFENFWFRLYTTRLATIAAVNGHATAGGCALALAFDYRIMSEGTGKPYVIGLNESKLGFVYPTWLLEVYKDLLGNRQADLHGQLSTLFPTDAAFKAGLIDEIATDENILSAAHKRMNEFLSITDHSRHACKFTFREDAVNRANKSRKTGDENRKLFCQLMIDPANKAMLKQVIARMSKSK